MSVVSYLDNNSLLGDCDAKRSYQELRMRILEEKDSLTYYLEQEDDIYGYTIVPNFPLTELYQFPCFVVRFVFSGINTLHQMAQEKLLNTLCRQLQHEMQTKRGYYNLRIPTHIVDLLRAVNSCFHHLIFCGGTVSEIYRGTVEQFYAKSEIETGFADQAFIVKNREVLKQLAFESFKNYQGQYHISPVMGERAGEIYRNWIECFFDDFKENTILIAWVNQEIAGFAVIEENETAVDFILSAASRNYRNMGIYKTMVAHLIRYAVQHDKLLISSTQLDNFIVQTTWSSLGMYPFFSIYNCHFDNR